MAGFESRNQELFSRVQQLAENDPDVQAHVRAAELKFLSLAKTAAWLAWDPGDESEPVPPHWEAAAAYIEAIIPGYVCCCARLSRNVPDLDRNIDGCVRHVSSTVFQHKILLYSRGSYWTSDRAARQFEQFIRNRLAPILTELRARAWETNSCLAAALAASGPGGLVQIALDRTGQQPMAIQRPEAAGVVTQTPVGDRRQLLACHRRQFNRTVKQICKEAGVDPSDFHKWVRGDLQPPDSAKGFRIDAVLRAAAVPV